jgi:hypothetical protein
MFAELCFIWFLLRFAVAYPRIPALEVCPKRTSFSKPACAVLLRVERSNSGMLHATSNPFIVPVLLANLSTSIP